MSAAYNVTRIAIGSKSGRSRRTSATSSDLCPILGASVGLELKLNRHRFELGVLL
jgi:hypothetical protein